jgi:predicted N-acetyltransferase YhbS
MGDEINLTRLGAGESGLLADYWSDAHPLHPMTAEMLRLRLLEAPGDDPDLKLAARDGAGGLAGVAVGVYPLKEAGVGGVRWLGVAPAWRGRGVEARLLEAMGERLGARGARRVSLFATPPYYLRPGVDTRETGLIATLLDLGWTHEATHFNMTVDLAASGSAGVPPAPQMIVDEDARGYAVRRARLQDRDAFVEYMTRDWTPVWREEADQAFRMETLPLFLAWRDEEIVGFAACEVSQCLGGFGPTGVSPEHRGAGLGRRLLWACLDHLRRAGRPTCEIGWVGPVSFYHRACGATLGPVYWTMSRAVRGASNQ